MAHQSHSTHKLFARLIASSAILALTATIAAESRGPTQTASCDGGHVQVTLGLPLAYSAPQSSASSEESADVTSLCISTASGNPYELLSWLENGSLRAVVLPKFAVDVLRADDRTKYERDYVDFAPSPVAPLKLKRRVIELYDADGHLASAKELNEWFDALAAASTPDNQTIVLPHHLSLAVPELLQRALRWADAKKLADQARENFMERIVGAIRFQLVPDAPTPATLRFVERVDDVTLNRDAVQIDESPLRIAASDRLVMRRQLLTNLPTLLRDARSEVARTAARGKKSASADTSITTSALFAVTLADEQRLGADVAEFRANNYHRFADGSMSRRYFRFLLPELWTVLQSRDAEKSVDSPTANGLALVLTGGGVKATYQTRLIDALYGHNKETQADVRLTNDAKIATNSATTSRPTERVNYVIGTSGGALLGMFVGTLNNSILTQDGWTGLTEMLWRPQGNDLKSTQIFPLLDMLRYFSVLVCFWLLWLVMTVAVHWFGDRWWTHVHVASKAATTTKTTESNNEVIIRWRSESWPWIILLAAAPIIVVQICDRWDLEHVPPIAGVYYTLMAVIAWYSDVSLTPIRQFKWRRARITKIFFALVIVGLACIAIPIGGQWRVEYCEPVPWQINLCFFGFLLLAGACYMFFAQQREYFKHEPWHEGIVMLFGLIGMVLISYLMVWLGVQLRLTAFLELTGGFWQWLLPSMFAFSLLLLYFGRVTAGQAPKTTAQRAVGYLFGEHNSRAFWTSHRRYTRFVIIATISWLWWNALVAPGLYGNCSAQEYFNQTYATFAEATQSSSQSSKPLEEKTGLTANCEEENSSDAQRVEISLTVPFVVTATSLEKGQERYFLFLHHNHSKALGDQAWFNLASDGRWLTVPNYRGCDLRAAAFASGSPFPVFSSHQVALASLNVHEQLIDGGFAHNKPLDAARVLNASKVLVLNSSPLEETIANRNCQWTDWFKWGELSCNVPKLLPYLWSRSQVEDSLSSAQMLVASIYPAGDGDAWPMLTDFRGATVDRMIKAADNDLKRKRIGTIESWGAPRSGDAYLLPVNTVIVQRELAK